jgi:hypothetical protein
MSKASKIIQKIAIVVNISVPTNKIRTYIHKNVALESTPEAVASAAFLTYSCNIHSYFPKTLSVTVPLPISPSRDNSFPSLTDDKRFISRLQTLK